MPWCETCDRFLSPSTVRADGACPACGRTVDAGRAHMADPERTGATPAVGEPVTNIYGEPVDDEKAPLPWHLKLLAGALAVYLGYRFLQGIEWVFGG